MRIDKALTINGAAAELVNHQIRLQLQTPGRSIITALTDNFPEIGQPVLLDARLSGFDWRPVFFGWIESAQQLNTGAWQLITREPAALLNRRITINLRHPLPVDVLNALADATGLVFIMPDSEWAKVQVPRFQHIGGGYGALDNLLRVWAVAGGIWQQQPDGRVYVGERSLSSNGKKVIELPASAFSDLTSLGGMLPLMPRLRPGVAIKISDGPAQIVHTIDITGDTMRLQWRPTINTALKALA